MRKRILVAEDDTDLRETILDILESAGYEVVMAATGPEALEALRERRRLDLILLDLDMPDVDGLELRRRMLEISDLSGVPVVPLSGDARGPEPALTLGFAHPLIKPFGEEDLLAIVSRCCPDR